MRILCAGLSHKTAPLALREQLAFAPEQIAPALGQLRNRWADGQYLLLSTCNRTEVYAVRPLHGRPREEELARWLADFHPHPAARLEDSLYVHTGQAAVAHLFAVAAGLDSLVPGEPQIVAQIKDALAASRTA